MGRKHIVQQKSSHNIQYFSITMHHQHFLCMLLLLMRLEMKAPHGHGSNKVRCILFGRGLLELDRTAFDLPRERLIVPPSVSPEERHCTKLLCWHPAGLPGKDHTYQSSTKKSIQYVQRRKIHWHLQPCDIRSCWLPCMFCWTLQKVW